MTGICLEGCDRDLSGGVLQGSVWRGVTGTCLEGCDRDLSGGV